MPEVLVSQSMRACWVGMRGRVSWGEEVGGRGGAYILYGCRENANHVFGEGRGSGSRSNGPGWLRTPTLTKMLCCVTVTLIDLLPTPSVLELLQW